MSEIEIKSMTVEHMAEVVEMMRVFYASPAVLSNGSEEIFQNNVENCVNDNPYLEGYVFAEKKNKDDILGYAMVAKSFSTEFGKPCMWIEDLYLKPSYRGNGIGTQFFSFIGKKYPKALLRLEVEAENERAIHVYKKCGFEELPYLEMKR